MIEIEGDFWEYPAEYRCVTTNAVLDSQSNLVMGAGIALEAKRRFPGLPAKLGRYVQKYGSRVFLCKEEGIIAFPTKDHWRNPSQTKIIHMSALQLIELVNKFKIRSVALPRVGCGNGGLKWENVRVLLKLVFEDDQRFIAVSPI